MTASGSSSVRTPTSRAATRAGAFRSSPSRADGTNLRQITSSLSGSRPVISGNGAKIAWENISSREVDAINWDGTGFKLLTPSISNSMSPSITDDAQFVFFAAYAPATSRYEISKVKTDATGLTQLTSSGTADLNTPVVAGGGGRVVFAGTVQTTSSLDGSGRLEVMTGSGTNRLQLMATTAQEIAAARITRDGTRIVFMSDMDPFGTNSDGGYEIFRMQTDGTGLVQVTNIPSGSASSPSITADGNTIVFDSGADIAGQNPFGTHEIFRINADGTGVQRLTSSSYSFDAVISANGSVVVYDSLTSGLINVGVVNADGTGQLDLTSDGGSWQVSVDDTGTWIALQSVGNLTGDSPNVAQVYRMRTDGTGLQRVSADPTRNAISPEISGTGTRIVYISNADPVGTNPIHLSQPFTFDTATSQTWQVTTAQGVGLPASISGDGNWVVCLASTDWAQPNPNAYLSLYRVPATGGPVERIGAGSTTFPGGDQGLFDGVYKPRTDMTATRTVFGGTDDPTGQNPDYSYDLWMVDLTREPEIRVSQSAPTLVSWDYEAGPIRYDVIRGDVANLAPGPPGTVDLGPVACLENDLHDADTRGFEDAVIPPAGHVFFFLFRGSRGLNFGPGSWGQSSAGAEREPGSGVCAP